MPDRPNVLLVTVDQYLADAVADDSYHTPHAAAMAASGTRFTGCYTPHPQCSPARSSLLTGRYPHRTGMSALPGWGPGPLDTGEPSVARAFRAAGYDTAYAGKWHLGEGNVGEFGWERRLNVHETGNPPASPPVDTTTCERAVEYIEGHDDDRPFFLVASFNLPHRPYYRDGAFADRYEPAALPLPANVDDDLADKPAFHRSWAPGDVPEEYSGGDRLSEEALRDLGTRYRTMVSRADGYLGRLRDALDRAGLARDTVVVFLADHGDMAGGHGLFGKHTLAYEEQLRVPLLVDRPGDAGGVVDDLVSLVSVPGTLADLAGIDAAFEGGSLAGTLDGGDAPGGGGDRVFFEHRQATGEHHPYRGVRTPDWKYVDYFGDGVAELYDLAADPGETENLAGDPACADAQRRLRGLVVDWWERTGGDTAAWAAPLGD